MKNTNINANIGSNSCLNSAKTNGNTEKNKSKKPNEWDKVFEYIKSKIFNYDSSQKLSTFLIMRVKGLSSGKYYLNNKTSNKASYSVDVIYTTCVYCTEEIKKAFRSAKDENHKINLLCYIIDKNINTIQDRILTKKANENQINLLNNEALEDILNTQKYISKKKNIDESKWN